MRLGALCEANGTGGSADALGPQGGRRLGPATTTRAMRGNTQVTPSFVRRTLAIVLVCLICAATGEPIAGEVMSAEEIVKALTTVTDEGGTRGIAVAPRPGSLPPGVNLDIPFGLNSDQLQPSATAQLDQLAQALQSDALASSRVEIVGHTDSSGAAAYNLSLSLRRATAVRNYLVAEAGIGQERLAAVGRGEEEPIPGTDPASARNRRVEITLLDRK